LKIYNLPVFRFHLYGQIH